MLNNAADLLNRAVLIIDADSYNPSAKGSVFNPQTVQFSVTGLLERANCGRQTTGFNLPLGKADALADAKAALCRLVGMPHLDVWEKEKRPNWRQVRQAFAQAERDLC